MFYINRFIIFTKTFNMEYQPGLFDLDERIAKINSFHLPLKKLSQHIDFEFFRLKLEKHFEKDKYASKGGRPPYDYVLMFKIWILQQFYNLSDDQTEICINDRISFMEFLDLKMGHRIPDAKTIWNFRNELAKANLTAQLFTTLYALLKREDKIVYGDSAYRSEEIENKLLKKNKKSKILEKGKRGKPLTASQIKRNQKKSTIRVKVEHIFGYMTNSMNDIFIKSIGKMRAQCQIGLKNITYNLFILAQQNVKIIMYRWEKYVQMSLK